MVTNKQIARAFRIAKGRLRLPHEAMRYSDKARFICIAIVEGIDWCETSVAAKKIVMERLGYSTEVKDDRTVEMYLREVLKVRDCDATPYRVQEYRHAWLDSLIVEFETKED